MRRAPGGGPGERPILTPTQREDLLAAIRGAYGGTANFEKPLILDGLIERVEKISNSISEMDFLDSSKLTKSRILQAFGVSPILLGEVEGANRASAQSADCIFVDNTVNPLIELISQAITKWLAPKFAGKNEKLKVYISPAKAKEVETLVEKWTVASKLGHVSRNEFRRTVLNLDDVEGGDQFFDPPFKLPSSTPAKAAKINGTDIDPYTLERMSFNAPAN